MRKLVVTAAILALLAAMTSETLAATPPYKVPPGQRCKGVPKTKLPGQKKTQFAICVTGIAKLAKNTDLAPSQVCAPMKKGVKGKSAKNKAQKNFKACVAAGKQLKLDLANA